MSRHFACTVLSYPGFLARHCFTIYTTKPAPSIWFQSDGKRTLLEPIVEAAFSVYNALAVDAGNGMQAHYR